jgi:hypothetical protein
MIIIEGLLELNSTTQVGDEYAASPPYQDLDKIAIYLRDYITTSLRNTSFFSYSLDGNQYSISDGGNDMFDSGNYTTLWLIAETDYTQGTTIPIPPCLSYSQTTATVTDTDFYHVSLGYGISPDRRPLTFLGARSGTDGPIGFQKAGNIGADGSGNITISDVYTGSIINGFTVHAYYRQTFGQAADPAICDLYILLGHPSWNSTFGTIYKYSSTNKSMQGAYFYTKGAGTKNILAITTLLSRASPTEIPLNDIQTVVQNYTLRIKEALGF